VILAEGCFDRSEASHTVSLCDTDHRSAWRECSALAYGTASVM